MTLDEMKKQASLSELLVIERTEEAVRTNVEHEVRNKVNDFLHRELKGARPGSALESHLVTGLLRGLMAVIEDKEAQDDPRNH